MSIYCFPELKTFNGPIYKMKRKYIAILTAFLLILFLSSQAWAANYYVTQAGAGDKSGQPTVADAMPVATFNALSGTGYAGDFFYFSGAITSEVKPGISGTSGGGYVTLDGYQAGSCDPINSVCGSSAAIDRNDPGDGTYDGIFTNNQDYLIIQDFRITDCSAGITSSYPSTSDHIIIKRNHISVCRSAGIYGSSSVGYWTIGGSEGDGNVIYNIGLGGTFSAPAGLRFYQINDVVASYNYIYNDDETYGDPVKSDGIVVMSSNRHLYEYNTIHDQGEDGIDWKGYSQQLIFRFNNCYNTYQSPFQVQRGTDYSYVYGNRLWNANEPGDHWHGFLIYRGADQVKAWANLIFNNRGSGIAIYKDSSDTSGDPVSSTGCVFYNNVIVENVRDGDDNSDCGVLDYVGTGAIFKNNIFARNEWGGTNERQLYFASISGRTLDYNLYYYNSSDSPKIRVGSTYYTLTDPVSGTSFNTATGQEDHGNVGNPLFIDIEGWNFRLQSTSPARNTGADLSGLAGSMQVQGVTHNMYYDDCLDPDNTDWSTIPPTVATKKQNDYVSWEKGAYIYTGGGPGPDPNEAPTAIIVYPPSNITINEGETVTFEFSGSDPDPLDVLTYIGSFSDIDDWVQDGTYAVGALVENGATTYFKCILEHTDDTGDKEPPNATYWSTTPETTASPGTATYATKGNYTVSLKVNDGTVDSPTVTVPITVLDVLSPTITDIFTRNSAGTPWGFDAHVDTGDATYMSQNTTYGDNINYSSSDTLITRYAGNLSFQTLVQYDLASKAAAEITDGIFSLYLETAPGVTTNIGLYPVTTAWTEDGVTWNCANGVGDDVGSCDTTEWTDYLTHDVGGLLKEIQLTPESTINQYYDWQSPELSAYLQSRAGLIAYFLLKSTVTDWSGYIPVWSDDTGTDGTRPKLSTTSGSEAGEVPVLVNIECPGGDGNYKEGDTTPPFKLNFNVSCEYDQTVVLKLDTDSDGANDAVTTVNAGSGTSQLTAPGILVTADHHTIKLDALQCDVTAGYLRSVADETSIALTGTAFTTFPTGADPGSLASNNNIIIDVTAPTTSSVNNTCTDCSGNATYATAGTLIVYEIELSESPIILWGQPDHLKQPTNIIGTGSTVYAQCIGLGDDTGRIKMGVELTVGMRIGVFNFAGALEGISVTDLAGNPINVDMGALSLADVAAIVIAVPYPSTSPKKFTTTDTWADAITAGWHSVPSDNLNFNVTENINTDKPGTSGHEIVYTGTITGTVTVDEDYINLERLIIN